MIGAAKQRSTGFRPQEVGSCGGGKSHSLAGDLLCEFGWEAHHSVEFAPWPEDLVRSVTVVGHHHRPTPEGDGGLDLPKLPRPLPGATERGYEASEGIDDHDPHVVVVLAGIGDEKVAGSVEGQRGDGGEHLPWSTPVAHPEYVLEIGGERDVLRGEFDDRDLGSQRRWPSPSEQTDNVQGNATGLNDARHSVSSTS